MTTLNKSWKRRGGVTRGSCAAVIFTLLLGSAVWAAEPAPAPSPAPSPIPPASSPPSTAVPSVKASSAAVKTADDPEALRAIAAGRLPTTRPLAAVVGGYPALDAPLYTFAFKRRGFKVVRLDQVWLSLEEYPRYTAVVITGGLARARMASKAFDAADLVKLQQFMESGGTFVLGAQAIPAFGTAEGQQYLQQFLGLGQSAKQPVEMKVLKHAWAGHLAETKDLGWLLTVAAPLRVSKGERVIASESGDTALFRLRVGRGQFIYVGWEFAKFLPDGRNRSTTVEDEARHEAQFKVLTNIVADIEPRK